MDEASLPLGDGSVDGWWASAVLLHLHPADALMALHEAHRVTKSGGVGFVAVRQGDGARIEAVDDTPYRRYFCYWQAAALDESLADAGWDIHEAWTAPDSAGRHPWLTRIVRRRAG